MERIKAETKSYKMNKALSWYMPMATAVPVTLEEVADKIVISISELIHVPIVAGVMWKMNSGKLHRLLIKNDALSGDVIRISPLRSCLYERHLFQITANLNQLYPTYGKVSGNETVFWRSCDKQWKDTGFHLYS